MTTASIVYLHNHRVLPNAPDKELERLLFRLLHEKHNGDLVGASDAYADEKTAQILAQFFSGNCLDREQLYEALIAWALIELGDLTNEGEAASDNTAQFAS